ncbi:hypothetical protein NDU88_006563, partial [Pleurodeles waltl]
VLGLSTLPLAPTGPLRMYFHVASPAGPGGSLACPVFLMLPIRSLSAPDQRLRADPQTRYTGGLSLV